MTRSSGGTATLETAGPAAIVDRPDPPDVAAARAKHAEYDAQIRAREADITAAEERRRDAEASRQIATVRGDVIGKGEAEAAIIEADQAIAEARAFCARTNPLRIAWSDKFAGWDRRVKEYRSVLLEIAMIDKFHAPRLRAVDAMRDLFDDTATTRSALIEEWGVGLADRPAKLYYELGKKISPGCQLHVNATAAVARRSGLVAIAAELERALWPR